MGSRVMVVHLIVVHVDDEPTVAVAGMLGLSDLWWVWILESRLINCALRLRGDYVVEGGRGRYISIHIFYSYISYIL